MFALKEKRGLWRRKSALDIEAPTSHDPNEGETRQTLGDGSVPWQIFHEPQPEETAELIWDPIESLSEETADLQPNRGFSGFS